ncbi:MAG TPA: NADH-quinone oxidoreductase subunit NuoN [Actinobacteria bacterium]|nr:NADH-quinone oxidoreductase subunit NuoN [Actinomycetota bacterium]
MTHTLAAGTFPTPIVEYRSLLPVLLVLGAAVIGVLIEALLPRRARLPLQWVVTFGSLATALVALLIGPRADGLLAEGALAWDGPTRWLQALILVLAIVALLLFTERRVDPGRDPFAPRASTVPGSDEEKGLTERLVQQTEVYPLALFAVGGMLLFPAANDLLMMFVALEVLSLPLYLLAGMARRRRLMSQEAALKYFLLGAYSSAFFIFGAALLYGYSGSLDFARIAAATGSQTSSQGLLLAGTALIAVGLLFKVGAAPFHEWTPDVYQGAPTAVTAFMAATTKVAAFGALLRLFLVALGPVRQEWLPLMWVIAALTMIVGVVMALTQQDIKRLLAYSSIAHTGFLLTGLVAASPKGTGAVLFYLAAYGFATIGAFGIITLVRDSAGEATHLSAWAGLGRRAPGVAWLMTLFLLSMAGIPLTAGFPAKFAVFAAASASGASVLVIVGVITSAIAGFFYVRVIVVMFFTEPAEDSTVSVAVPSWATTAALAISAAVTLALGLLPQSVLEAAARASVFVR